MSMSDIVSLISGLGFPIVACCAMGMYIYKTNQSHTQEIARLNDQHQAEVTKMTEALNNNTIAITKLCEKLNGGAEAA